MRSVDELSDAERLFLRQLWMSHPAALGWGPQHPIHGDVEPLVTDGYVERRKAVDGPDGWCYRLSPYAVAELETVAERVSLQAVKN